MNRSKPTYRRLHKDDRHVIYQMRKAGNTQAMIARTIGFSQSTISKELSRNKGLRGYRPAQAQRKAEGKQSSKKTRSCVLTGKTLDEIEGRLRKKHSPEQISLRLAREHGQAVLSHQTIYNYIATDKQVVVYIVTYG